MDDQVNDYMEEPNTPLPPEEDEPQDEPERASRPWLLTAAIAVLMLAIGALLGYFGRGEFGPEARAAKATDAAQAVLAQTQAAAGADMMKFLIENTRHFKGDANAPVTIIEFSDYQ